MQEEKDFKAWVKAHKKELIAIGISAVGLALLIAGVKNKDKLIEIFRLTKNAIQPQENGNIAATIISNETSNIVPIESYIPKSRAPHHVEGHPMKLATGRTISEEMLEFVKDNNIELPPNYTFRRSYETGSALVS